MRLKIILIVGIVILPFQFSFAQEGRKLKEPLTVNGDKVEYIPDKNIMIAEGNVEVVYEGMFLYADKLTVWMDKNEALAEGNVKLIRDGATFYGDKVSYYFKENKGKIISPRFEKYGPWYGKGLEAEEYEKGKYFLKKAYITTCDLEKPHYRFQAKSVKVIPGEKIIARNVVFYIKDTPVFYLPYFSRSLKDRKMPFMLIPGRNDDWGWYLLTNYRYYLNKDNFGRLKLDYREKKGWAYGFDHRYNFLGHGLAKVYYMNEKNSELAENDRYRISFRHSWQPDIYTSVFAELNKLSDADFLKDYFYEEDYERDYQPSTYLYVLRQFPLFTFSFNLKGRVNKFYTETQRLPEIGLDFNDLRIKDSNFYYNSSFYLANLSNKNANSDIDDDVWRIDTYNEISHVKKYFGFLNFSPYIGVRETFYSKNELGEEHKIRGALYTGFDASVKFYKIFYPQSGRFLFSPATAVRHTIRPVFNYSYITEPTISKNLLMQFDDIDAIERKSRLKISLENLWETKYQEDDKGRKRELLRLILSAIYDFRIEGGSRWQTAEVEMEYTPLDWLKFESDIEYELKPGHINTANFDLLIEKKRWQLGLGQRYEQDTSSQLTTEFRYKINSKWSTRVYQRHDFQDMGPERQEFSIYRDLHCWLAEFTFVNNRLDGNKEFFIIFTLKAFPSYPFKFSQSYHPPH
ncbi:MAG: hypothetical protein B6D53_02455 [Candidatus Omnitrophica bacterium 4484_49]|nr:MAG: hypothetical protein B6D53_02455 [Candidatus Omnitrophica bacterium 4484_49]